MPKPFPVSCGRTNARVSVKYVDTLQATVVLSMDLQGPPSRFPSLRFILDSVFTHRRPAPPADNCCSLCPRSSSIAAAIAGGNLVVRGELQFVQAFGFLFRGNGNSAPSPTHQHHVGIIVHKKHVYFKTLYNILYVFRDKIIVLASTEIYIVHFLKLLLRKLIRKF